MVFRCLPEPAFLGVARRREQVFNFAAGPGAIPEEVLLQARDELLDWRGTGMSVWELPFTGAEFREITARAADDLRQLLAIPSQYRVLFMHGGASAQFSLIPLNLLRGKGSADYADTGHWSRKAIIEARRYCAVNVAASGAATGFDRIPAWEEWRLDPGAAYCHITANETANGSEYHWVPDTGAVPLVADMTSNFLSRPVEVVRYGLIYAGAQKNIGPAGLTVVVVREDLIGGAAAATPSVFDYAIQAEADCCYNTPLTYAIYLAGLVFQWLKRQGGLTAMEARNARKSHKLYAAIARSGGFYRCPVIPRDRSRMNVCFTLADPALTESFLEQAAECGLVNLRGHKAAGGLRASLYNAMPEEGVARLVEFMDEFARTRG